eukprot:jgi/Undpi1/5707/HiC_scaffold_2.g00981.m1
MMAVVARPAWEVGHLPAKKPAIIPPLRRVRVQFLLAKARTLARRGSSCRGGQAVGSRRVHSNLCKPVRERVHAIAAVEPNNSDTYGAVFHGKGGEGDLHLAMLLVLGKPEGGCYHDGGSCFCGYNRRGEGDECNFSGNAGGRESELVVWGSFAEAKWRQQAWRPNITFICASTTSWLYAN